MKKIKLNSSKLQFKKDTIGNLSDPAMSQMVGGRVDSLQRVCTNWPTNQCQWSVNGYCDSVTVCGTGTACSTGVCTAIQTCPGFCS